MYQFSDTHLQQAKSILEGLDSQLGQQGGLRGSDLVAGLDQVHVTDDLNGTLVDLGGNAQGLECKRKERQFSSDIAKGSDHLRGDGWLLVERRMALFRVLYLEERGLGGIHAGGATGDGDVVGGGEADTGGSSNLVLLNFDLDVVQVTCTYS